MAKAGKLLRTLRESAAGRLLFPTEYRCVKCNRRVRNQRREKWPFSWRNHKLVDWKVLNPEKCYVNSKGVAIFRAVCPAHQETDVK